MTRTDLLIAWPSSVPCTASTRIANVDGQDRVLLRLERNDEYCEVFVDALPLSDDKQRLTGALMDLGRKLRASWRMAETRNRSARGRSHRRWTLVWSLRPTPLFQLLEASAPQR